MKISDDLIKAYALKNAVGHGGKVNSGSVISSLFTHGLEKSKIKDVVPRIQKIIKEVEKLSTKEQKSELEKLSELLSEREVREGLPELPNVSKKGIVTRFAPSASGPLHIGHAIVAGLAINYVQKYGGKFILRIEDTNPENIDKNAYKLLEADAKWLYPKTQIVIQSDRMKLYYKYAEKFINEDSAYVCTCNGDKFRELAKEKKNCPCRDLGVKEQRKRYKKMFKDYTEGEAVLRFKSSMTHKNPAMRDFPLARINDTPHPRTKKKYRVWPLMNLAVTVDDIELKMTHIIRGKDHKDNSERQKMMFEVLGKKYPWTTFIGRVHLKGFELSTTKMREGIEGGKYSGWDDESLPSLVSFKKQGFKPIAFLKFAEKISLGENDKTIDKKEYLTMLKGFNKCVNVKNFK